MRLRTLPSFDLHHEEQTSFNSKTMPPDTALRWEFAPDAAVADLAAAGQEFVESYGPSRESADLPGGPYRDKPFGVGKRNTHRVIYCVNSGVIELVAVRHLHQRDLTGGDL